MIGRVGAGGIEKHDGKIVSEWLCVYVPDLGRSVRCPRSQVRTVSETLVEVMIDERQSDRTRLQPEEPDPC